MKIKVSKLVIAIVSLLIMAASCKKDKKVTPPVDNPPPPVNESEVITTLKLVLKDSVSGISATYMFKDPDGDGGIAGFYGPGSTSASIQSDSVISVLNNKTYFAELILLDETKNPADSISKSVKEEGDEHMFFYNNGTNTIINSSNPYTVKLNGSQITIIYLDADNANPQHGIGLKTKWRTPAAAGTTKFPLSIVLRHQPGSKNGTYSPGETDIAVDFKIQVN